MSEFTLNGGVDERDGKWQAVVVLKTPDGKQTKLESEFVYLTKGAAEKAMQDKLNEVLELFKKDGVEIVARDGVLYS